MGTVECSPCGKSFTSKDQLKRHKRGVHDGIVVECDTCDFKSTRKDNLDKHMLSKHSTKSYICDICQYQTKLESKYNEHYKYKHLGHKFECKFCEFNTTSKDTLYYHRQKAHSGKIIQCGLCQKIFTKLSSLKEHLMSLHIKTVVSFHCEHCPSKFGSTIGLTDHEQRMHEEVTCSICQKIFLGTNKLNKHINTTHGTSDKSNNTMFPCDKCTYVTKRKAHLKRHKDIKHSIHKINVSCDMCIKTFTSKDQLRRHKNKHDGLVLKCNSCQFETPRADSLKIHKQRKHATETAKKTSKTIVEPESCENIIPKHSDENVTTFQS